MIDQQTMDDIERIDERLQQVEETIKSLQNASSDYLQWMASRGYTSSTRANYRYGLKTFAGFVKKKRFSRDEIFTLDTLKAFQQMKGLSYAPAVRGLARYLFEHNRIKHPIENRSVRLPQEYEDYLSYYQDIHQATMRQIKHIRRVLSALDKCLHRSGTDLSSLKIEHVDAFLASFLKGRAIKTGKLYRSYLKGFLSYLYRERNIIKRDLAHLVQGAKIYGLSKPPKFLRPQEVQELFSNLQLSSPGQIRSYAMVHLAYFLGLRPKEISMIRLDDIFFSKAELTVENRKNCMPLQLPLPESVLKAIAAYIIGARSQSGYRRLFLSLLAP